MLAWSGLVTRMSTYNNRYQKHESVDLCALFARDKIPYQGQTPSKSRILIFGLDANYSSEISSHPQFFKKIIEYHEDGVAFWKKIWSSPSILTLWLSVEEKHWWGPLSSTIYVAWLEPSECRRCFVCGAASCTHYRSHQTSWILG